MNFYTTLSKYYDEIFPADPSQITAIKKITAFRAGAFADIGCGAGGLSRNLCESGFLVTGIDSDEGMIAKARAYSANGGPCRYICADMRDVRSFFGADTQAGVICFGNTLAHLRSAEDLKAFCEDVFAILSPGGYFILQILNYDMLRTKNITELPVIENSQIRFERRYEWLGDNEVKFQTKLFVKEEAAHYENSIRIYPRYKKEIDQYLKEAGFSNIKFYGSFSLSSLKGDSFVLIASGKKKGKIIQRK